MKAELGCGSLEFGLDPGVSKYTLKQEFLYKRRNKDSEVIAVWKTSEIPHHDLKREKPKKLKAWQTIRGRDGNYFFFLSPLY